MRNREYSKASVSSLCIKNLISFSKLSFFEFKIFQIDKTLSWKKKYDKNNLKYFEYVNLVRFEWCECLLGLGHLTNLFALCSFQPNKPPPSWFYHHHIFSLNFEGSPLPGQGMFGLFPRTRAATIYYYKLIINRIMQWMCNLQVEYVYRCQIV